MRHLLDKEPVFITECFALSVTDQTCKTHVKQIILHLSALNPVSNTPALCSQIAGKSNWILPHQWLLELSGPIQLYEGRGGLSLKDDNRLQIKLIYF